MDVFGTKPHRTMRSLVWHVPVFPEAVGPLRVRGPLLCQGERLFVRLLIEPRGGQG
jgi:hypothetical protein